MKKLVLTALAALGITAAHASPNFPFPRNASYPYGIKATNADSSDIQNAFTAWKGAQLDFTDTSAGLMRIKWDNTAVTVSEGIGYSMLIMVYMDNTTNNTEHMFDMLWNYYNKFKDSNGLMNWEITGYSTVSGTYGATDADLDVALALIRSFYGIENPRRLYFVGGSSGGREALAVAQQWPTDFDGVVSLYPAWNAATLNLQFGRITRALAAPGAYPNQAKRRALYDAAMQSCDLLDGVATGGPCAARAAPIQATNVCRTRKSGHSRRWIRRSGSITPCRAAKPCTRASTSGARTWAWQEPTRCNRA